MRREELYLSDIVESAEAISKFISGKNRDEFLLDDMLRSAVPIARLRPIAVVKG